jgi:catechol 2,3-dioxygenase-like lactoylglutathione lyase family enzyme
MKQVFAVCMALSLCFIALDLKPEEQPLVTRVDHFYAESDQARSLFTFFKETFQLPESWPFRDAGTHVSGGLWLGNTILEFLLNNGDKPVRTEFGGIAFEPAGGADETAIALSKRGISRAEVENKMRQGPEGKMRVAWSLLDLKDFPPTEADVFFVDYKFRKSVATKYKAIDDEFAARNRGPLGIIGVAEITVGVQDLEEARSKWSALLAPSPQISDDAFAFESGPRIRLVRAESPGIRGIVLSVRSLGDAERFLKERGLLAKDAAGRISITPAAIDGLSIQLFEAAQSRETANPFLGTGRGVDHVGIGVRDLEKARRDYEEVLGFKCTGNLPAVGGRALIRSIIFFEDETLLEFLSPSPGAPASGDEFREWVEKHEGGMSLALRISSAQDAAAYLEAHNFEVKVTGWPRAKEGETAPAPVQYYSLTTPDAPSGNRQVFMTWIWLVEYVSSPERSARRAARREQGLMNHPNTAKRLHSVWFAVRDLDASLRNLQDAGLEPREIREVKSLGAAGREVKAGSGCMLLLQSADEKGALEKFISNHDDGEIIGVSIEVADLNKARSWVESRSGQKLEPYDGFYGRSILIPPALTHGVWMELFQR